MLIADKHASVRRALSSFVAAFDDLVLAGEAACGMEMIRQCGRLHPDVVLLDASLPDLSVASATAAVRSVWPPAAVIAMCTFQEEDLAREALGAGASRCLVKNVSALELASAIRRADAA